MTILSRRLLVQGRNSLYHRSYSYATASKAMAGRYSTLSATTNTDCFSSSATTLSNIHSEVFPSNKPSIALFSTTSDSSPAEEDGASASKKKSTTMEFQAETKQLLDIVTNSLYTDKEVFLRELVSNASDALEKMRHVQTTGVEVLQPEQELQIQITLDEVESSITIQDTGIGMSQEEMISNLGTIARSGSKNFLSELEQSVQSDGLDIARGIIGKFGVGFYSVFMVAHKVQVTSQPAKGGPAAVWTSDGTGTYELEELDPTSDIRQDRGTTIKIFLNSDYWSLLSEPKIEEILTKYSNFVQFPILLNGKRVNTVQAVWSMDPREVEYDTYSEFYKYIAQAVDEPLDILHFRADAPLEVQALLFVPSFHSEKYGMDRMEPGVSLYSRKVLIESKSPDILPDWMRFVKGVVDSEDLPLAISREKPQDTALIRKLRTALTRKFLSNMEKMAKKEPEKYVDEFYREYSFFLKEGVCQDYEFQSALAKLLRFETNKNTTRDLISFDEYIGNLRPDQNEIYYLCAPTREAAAMSPYLEAFEKANLEVIFVYTAIDDFVMANLGTHEGRKLISVENGDIDLSKYDTKDNNDKEGDEKKDDDDNEKGKEEGDLSDNSKKLDPTQAMELCTWLKTTLGDKKVSSCRPSTRLVSSPAIVTDNESGAMRRMMRMVDTSTSGTRDGMPLPKQNVEINPSHPIIVGIYNIRDSEPVLARVLAEQVYDNCLVAAGLLDDSRTMLPRLNDLLVSLVKGAQDRDGTATNSESKDTNESK